MDALIHVIASLVTALAATAFAHFGVTLKAPAAPKSEQVVRRVPVSDTPSDPAAAAKLAVRHAPCPISARSERT